MKRGERRGVAPRERAVRVRLAATAATVAVVLAAAAHATETQWWVTDSPADYAKAESRGVVVRPDGSLDLGPAALSSPAESLSVIWAVLPLADGSVALAGDHGRLVRWTESGGVRPWVRLACGQVLSLALDGDGVLAGTAPDGVVYRVSARGDTSTFCRTGERYVWGLAPAGRGAWYAATGTRGRLLRVEKGRSTILVDTDESNLVSLIPDGKGGAFAGGDSKGRVLHVRADGTRRTVYDAAEDEIRGLAFGPDGALYAAGLTASAVIEDEGEDHPGPAKSAVSGARATVYRIVPDSSAISLWSSPQPFVFALVGTGEGVVAATGNAAGLYLLQPGGATQWLAVPQGQITALAVDRGGRLLAATSNPAALWRIGPDRATRGELLSGPLDARRYARFGRVRWSGDAGGGRIELATRSGNTEQPDTTWSAWEEAKGDADGARIGSPPARFLQWKLTLAGGRPRVESIEVSWREQNQPPRIEGLTVAPQAQAVREGEIDARSEAVTQTLPGGQKVEYSMSTSSQRPLRDLPVWARGLRTLQWRGSDPNGDPLRYRVDVRPESGGDWIEVGKDLEASSFTWNTTGLADGRYRVRVTATDAPQNSLGEERTAEALSEPFSIDNTPPQVTALGAQPEAGAIRVTGRAEDASSVLTRLEVSLDDGDWRTVSPEDGLADRRALSFSARLTGVKPGDHVVSARAVDLAGNTAVRAARVRVAPGR